MHDLACTLRPVANGALTPPMLPAAPPRGRFDPFGQLKGTWLEHFPFMFTTGATSVETQRSRVIQGAFQIVNITSNSQGAVAELNSLALFVADDDGQPTAMLSSGENVFAPMIGDTTTQQGAFPSQTSYLSVPLGYIHRGGTARLILQYNNTNAATRAVMALVSILHLRDAEPHEFTRRY